MTVKHTPGEWYQTPSDEDDMIRIQGEHHEIARVVHAGDWDQRDANARLIAAAPELLLALEGLVEAYGADVCNCCDPHVPNHCPCCIAREALAKATI